MKITPDRRDAALEARRALKMARSVHAYVRGNTAQFYQWLQASPAMAHIPAGPDVWICGDCHLGNLGPLADRHHDFAIQIRDLDQTVIGNPALDLIRLGLSLETAARSSDLPGVVTAQMLAAMIDGYARALSPETEDDPTEPKVVRAVRRRAAGRRWRHLANERIDGPAPTLPLGKRFWRLADHERDAVDALFADSHVRTRALALAGYGEEGHLRVLDAAYWRKGCSSLGRLRHAVVLGVRADKHGPEYLALVDIKEAIPSVAPAAPGATMPSDPAQRVVAGARALAPNLGERMIPAHLLGKSVVLRELAPQDLKIEVAQFSRRQAVAAASYLAYIVGMGHARQMSDATRYAWRDMLLPDQAQADGPSWLWQTVVDLAARHEAGYLEHCRNLM
ncbi:MULTISPECIES: DUF2252 family protein [unclassified Novosphingobium]|uniref:DUF2252 family protein n=1 Tax=unclassified Novosphingobium TaxID=2644732 RepID=UPI00185867E1|nr:MULTISPECIES: DUF2252 family protein [unclassified Novosphingobium]NMN07138.1 uncharacterized protein (DUF2252 family) [Novosphingobium sp. SG919]NMN89274.1 uncharacterized protein (DUF2252 family) [Novosphingobium sp. SG916]